MEVIMKQTNNVNKIKYEKWHLFVFVHFMPKNAYK